MAKEIERWGILDGSAEQKKQTVEDALLNILTFFEGFLKSQGIPEQDIKVINEVIKNGNNEYVGSILELLEKLEESWIELNDNIYKISIEPILVEEYVNSIENGWSLSGYWNDKVLETWSDRDIFKEKRNGIKTLLTRLLKNLNENWSELSDYNKDNEITENCVKRLKHIKDILNKHVYKPERYLYTGREFNTMRDYVENKELIRIIETLLEKLKSRWNIKESSSNDNEMYTDEQNSKLNDYLKLLDIMYDDLLLNKRDQEYSYGQIKRLQWPIKSLLESLSERKGKISRDLFDRISHYPEFYEIIIDNIWVFQIDSDDLEGFFASLLRGERFTNQKKAEKTLEYLKSKIDNFSWLDNAELPDLYYMELYFALYPIEGLGDDAPKDASLEERIEYCINNLKNMERERGLFKTEFKDFVDLLKTTRYWTPSNRNACYNEAKKRRKIEFIFDNYALWYFLWATTEKILYKLFPDCSLYYLPLFTDPTIISTINSSLSKRGNEFLPNYENGQLLDSPMTQHEREAFQANRKYFNEKECLKENLKCLEFMENRVENWKRWRINTGRIDD